VWTAAWALTLTLGLSSPAIRPAAGGDAPRAAATPATAWPDSRPLTHLFQNLVTDLAHVPSRASLVTAVVGGAGAGAVHPIDRDLADWAGRAGAASYTRAGNLAGQGATQAGAALATYVIGKIAHAPPAVHIGGDLIRAQVLNAVLTDGLKVIVGRTRPNGGRWSFPSGHTSASVATAAVLGENLGWRGAVPAGALAGFIGWTRLRDRAHYASDVVFGAAIGLIAGRTVAAGHRRRTWTVTPARTRGGFAIFVVRRVD